MSSQFFLISVSSDTPSPEWKQGSSKIEKFPFKWPGAVENVLMALLINKDL